MKPVHLGSFCTAVLALLIGCGGGGAAPSAGDTTGASTTAIGTTSVVGTTTTGGTAPATVLPAGTYYGTFSSTAFSSGGASTQGPSGSAELAVADDDGFVLTLGADRLEGAFATDRASFSGTFTAALAGGGTAVSPVGGTLIRAASRTVLRFSAFRDGSHSSGVRYSVGFPSGG